MICSYKYRKFTFPKSGISQLYTPLPELLKKLENGSIGKEDLQFNPQAYEYAESKDCDMSKQASSSIDLVELAADREVDNPVPFQTTIEPVTTVEVTE